MTQGEVSGYWRSESGREGVLAGSADPSALFPYWSFTKTVIAAAVLKLVEQGQADLDAPLPDAAYSLRQLLAHRAGLPDYGPLPAYHAAVSAGESAWPRDLLVARAMERGMLWPPGQGFAYSNVGYLFLREGIEAATGQGLGAALEALILAPLGLASVRLWEGPTMGRDLHWSAAVGYDPAWVYHGCLIGTARDAVTLLDALLKGDLLPAPLRREMQSAYPVGGALPGRPWERCGYGLGLMIGEATGAGATLGHSGVGPFCVNAVYHFPALADPVTVAAFSDGSDEAPVEHAAVQAALAKQNA
ncbi:serine hydrolase domain-containing protein [Pseudoruegeria sp. SHC-113]|uniref:serine hydrolase domain-containing protein n=1 Tax=Pseudoruegeria sp. SHC-113 TaxID=2855439 RepID=UPI0021BB497B|nr:serine hydrolase domain-containing protein [Pseudoruegeria sp. SHC-113]MCT8158990.1 beta-lactamase family protein [Pseudoruegeria sp. SHC-113]